jgi:hypothetical protein
MKPCILVTHQVGITDDMTRHGVIKQISIILKNLTNTQKNIKNNARRKANFAGIIIIHHIINAVVHIYLSSFDNHRDIS